MRSAEVDKIHGALERWQEGGDSVSWVEGEQGGDARQPCGLYDLSSGKCRCMCRQVGQNSGGNLKVVESRMVLELCRDAHVCRMEWIS